MFAAMFEILLICCVTRWMNRIQWKRKLNIKLYTTRIWNTATTEKLKKHNSSRTNTIDIRFINAPHNTQFTYSLSVEYYPIFVKIPPKPVEQISLKTFCLYMKCYFMRMKHWFFVCSFVVFPLHSIATHAVLSDFYWVKFTVARINLPDFILILRWNQTMIFSAFVVPVYK